MFRLSVLFMSNVYWLIYWELDSGWLWEDAKVGLFTDTPSRFCFFSGIFSGMMYLLFLLPLSFPLDLVLSWFLSSLLGVFMTSLLFACWKKSSLRVLRIDFSRDLFPFPSFKDIFSLVKREIGGLLLMCCFKFLVPSFLLFLEPKFVGKNVFLVVFPGEAPVFSSVLYSCLYKML